MLSVLKLPVCFSLGPLQTVYGLICSTFLGKEVLIEKKNQNLSNQTVKNDVKRLNKADRNVRTAWYSSETKLLLEYMKANSRCVQSAKRRTELILWLGWIGVMLILDSAEVEDLWIPKSGAQFLIPGMNCMWQ